MASMNYDKETKLFILTSNNKVMKFTADNVMKLRFVLFQSMTSGSKSSDGMFTSPGSSGEFPISDKIVVFEEKHSRHIKQFNYSNNSTSITNILIPTNEAVTIINRIDELLKENC